METIIKKTMFSLGVMAALLVSYLLAKVTTIFISGFFAEVLITPSTKSLSSDLLTTNTEQVVDIRSIIQRNFFDAEESQFESLDKQDEKVEDKTEDKQETVPQGNTTAVKTSLKLDLVSSFSVGDGTDSMSACVLEYSKNKDVYAVGESFKSGTKIVRILPKRVEFLNAGRLEYVEMPDYTDIQTARTSSRASPRRRNVAPRRSETSSDEGIQRDGNSFKIACSEYKTAMSNVNQIATYIRAVPYFKDGRANGLKILSVKRGTIFDKLGIRRGDILKTINGETLDMTNGLKLFSNLSSKGCSLGELSMDVERRGVDLAYKYEIVE